MTSSFNLPGLCLHRDVVGCSLAKEHSCSAAGTVVLNGMGRMAAAIVSSPFFSQRLTTWISKQNDADLMTLAAFIETGRVKPQVDKTYILSETSAAVSYLEAGHTQGKVVITV